MHMLFCLEMFLRRVENVQCAGFKRFCKHAFPFLSWNALAESCERFWWLWAFLEACIPFSVLKCSCRELWTFLVVLNVFWSMHSLFCLEMLLQCCERFWWLWTFFEACIPFSVLKCSCRELWTFLVVLNVFQSMHTSFYTEMFCGWMMQPIHFRIYTDSLRWFLTIQRLDAFFSYTIIIHSWTQEQSMNRINL